MKMPFRYGCVVDGEYFCPRPELERQLRNYAESGPAESLNDFLHKLSVALKEAEETCFWLQCVKTEHPDNAEAAALWGECHEFVKILQSSITTARRNAAT